MAALALPLARGADSGASVVVVYNSRLPESKQVAEHYARQRQVPASQVFGFDLPTGEAMTRNEFIDQLQKPLLKSLETNHLFTFSAAKEGAERRLVDAKVRYAVLCYGVPTKILRDTNLVEAAVANVQAELRRNEAAVDSQLACLPMSEQKLPWSGPLQNIFYGATNASLMHPTNGILLVTRLDGPTAAIARGLVDKALQAETNGLWGRAYFDSRGMTNGEYKLGDDWIRGAAQASIRHGFETVLDEAPTTFPASFPMSQIAFYVGWYDGTVSGPFTQPNVEFMPGAFAYHLHSFSAMRLRTTNEYWVGPLLNKGATATFGFVEEPYLGLTPEISFFFARWMFLGFSFGEAAYAAQNVLSWQTTVVGDPLYRPAAKRPDVLHQELERRNDKLVEWSYLRVINQALASGADRDDAMAYLEKLPLTKTSSVLKEKLADFYWTKKKFSDALETYQEVLKLEMSPQQKSRVMLTLAQRRTLYGPDKAAYDLYTNFLKEFPDYPDLLGIYQKLLPLAQKLAKKEEAARYAEEIKRLSQPPSPAPKS
jgi:uncharacterized protein (TIGR03790 family)